MRAILVSAAVLCAYGVFSGTAPAQNEPTTAPAPKVDAKRAFEEIRNAVVGKWKLDPEEAKVQSLSGATEFKLTAGGSVIMETMLPGEKFEMVNLYAIDNEDLLVTHYCASGNQPRMKLVKAEKGVYTFEFKDGTNIKSDGKYMGKLILTLADGKVIEDWTHFEKGKPAGEMHLPMVRH